MGKRVASVSEGCSVILSGQLSQCVFTFLGGNVVGVSSQSARLTEVCCSVSHVLSSYLCSFFDPLLICVCFLFLPDSEDEDPEYKPLRMPFKDDMDDFTNSPLDDKDDTAEGEAEGNVGGSMC